MTTLAQIHICLECMLFIEEHIECPIENLQNLFVHVYKEFVSAQSPLQHYNELYNKIFTLKVPLPNSIAYEMDKMYVHLILQYNSDIDIRILKKILFARGVM